MARRWAALAVYTALLYGTVPLGLRLGNAVQATVAGAWLLGPGFPLLGLAGTLGLIVLLRRRRAPARSYLALAAAVAISAVVLSSVIGRQLERTHLPEYGVAAWLAWRAVDPVLPGLPGYLAAAGVGAAIGFGEELLQWVVPGRYYDLRDVAMNALGAVIGVLVIAAVRAPRR